MVAPAAPKTVKKAAMAPQMKKVKKMAAQKMKALVKVATNVAAATAKPAPLVYTAISPASTPGNSPAKPTSQPKTSTGQSSTIIRRPRITINMRTGRCTIHEPVTPVKALVQPKV